jgi:hypothetical protein
MNNLIELPKESALDVFMADKGLDPYIEIVRKEVSGLVPDVTSRKGRDHIASIAAKIAKSKTYLDGVGKELVAELKRKPKIIDAERKRMRDILDALKDDVREPLTRWEEEQRERRETIEAEIANIIAFRQELPDRSEAVKKILDSVKQIGVDESFFGEFSAQAADEIGRTVRALSSHYNDCLKREAEQEELKRLRAEMAAREAKERDERIAREAAERARLEAEEAAKALAEKAKAELELAKLEAERRDREAKEREAELQRQVEQAKLEKEEREKAEKERMEAERIRLEKEEAERKEAEKLAIEQQKLKDSLKQEREREALQALSEVTHEFMEVFNAIKNGNIPHITLEA